MAPKKISIIPIKIVDTLVLPWKTIINTCLQKEKKDIYPPHALRLDLCSHVHSRIYAIFLVKNLVLLASPTSVNSQNRNSASGKSAELAIKSRTYLRKGLSEVCYLSIVTCKILFRDDLLKLLLLYSYAVEGRLQKRMH